MGKVHRKKWPRIREVVIKGELFYRMDARRTGTNGRQETFKKLEDANKRAGELEKDVLSVGHEALDFPADFRGLALSARQLLEPYGKTVYQAAEFYKAHLDAILEKQKSATVASIAGKWMAEKKSGKNRKLRDETLRGIKDTGATLAKVFADKKMLEVSTADIRAYLDGLEVSLRRKFNINSRLSQFFNWSVKHGHCATNPCLGIDIHVENKEVAIFTAAEAIALMKLAKEKYADLVLYHAISLFAGLRPDECLELKWENVHLVEKQITVLGTTSKTKESRTVPIEPTLLHWLDECKPEKPKGYVTEQTNFKKRNLAFHVALGYRGAGENKKAAEWPQDVLRHSYGSYWLAKFKNRATLAENMGNSVQIIKKHYKRVVSKSECEEYWKIVPGYEGKGVTSQVPSLSRAEEKALRMKRVVASLRADEAEAKTETGGGE